MRGKSVKHIQLFVPAKVHEDLKHEAVAKDEYLGEFISKLLVSRYEQRKEDGKVWEDKNGTD